MAVRSNGTTTGHRRGDISAFIDACLEPLSDEVLIDTALNADLRAVRRDEWYRVSCMMHFWKAVLDASAYTNPRLPCYVGMAFGLPDREEALKNYKKAYAEQLLTPASRKGDLDWKRREFKSQSAKSGWYLPVKREQVEAVIAADEAFLAAHPTKRTHRISKPGEAI